MNDAIIGTLAGTILGFVLSLAKDYFENKRGAFFSFEGLYPCEDDPNFSGYKLKVFNSGNRTFVIDCIYIYPDDKGKWPIVFTFDDEVLSPYQKIYHELTKDDFKSLRKFCNGDTKELKIILQTIEGNKIKGKIDVFPIVQDLKLGRGKKNLSCLDLVKYQLQYYKNRWERF